jgi:hypothetical protein
MKNDRIRRHENEIELGAKRSSAFLGGSEGGCELLGFAFVSVYWRNEHLCVAGSDDEYINGGSHSDARSPSRNS